MTLNFDGMTKLLTAAWNSGDPKQVACFFAPGKGIINRGEEQFGEKAMVAIEAGFMASFPDLNLTRDFFQLASDHGVFDWAIEGHQAETGNPVDSTRRLQATRRSLQ